MKLLAFDISTSNTGWAFLNLTKFKIGYTIQSYEYGNIQPSMTMDQCQKLYFFGNRIKELLEKFEPDEVVFEEAILVMGHGFSTARSLSRLGGVGMYFAHQFTKKEVYLYEPGKWKKQLGLSSRCHKVEVQLKIVQDMKLLSKDAYEKYINQIQDEYKKLDLSEQVTEKEQQHKVKLNELKERLKTEVVLKLNVKQVVDELKAEQKKELTALKEKLKKDKKKLTKEFDKNLVKIGTSIYSETGVNFDAADAFGVGFCVLKELGF